MSNERIKIMGDPHSSSFIRGGNFNGSTKKRPHALPVNQIGENRFLREMLVHLIDSWRAVPTKYSSVGQ